MPGVYRDNFAYLPFIKVHINVTRLILFFLYLRKNNVLPTNNRLFIT